MSNRHAKYDRSPKGKARASKRNKHKRQQHEERYRNRPFIAWDGEGITESDGSHTYFLLANSVGDSLQRREGLSTVECFDMLLAHADDDAIHVVYGGSYDVNMMLRDVDLDTLQTLYAGERVKWQGYRMQWRDGKSLQLSREHDTVTLYDVSPFFQCAFVKACDEYLGDDWEARDQIVREKANRGTFQWEHAAEVASYNQAELRNLVRLCVELRERLFKVGIRIRRWDGPGAIAAALLTQYKVRECIGESPETVARLTRYAYAGGRFECMRFGHSESGAYQYDVRSAYPSAMRALPCLAHGEWEHVTMPKTVESFGLYHCLYNQDWSDDCWTKPGPLFVRNRNGTVTWPLEAVDSWYWSPEAELALEFGHVIEGWVWRQKCTHEPFAFVEALYNKRAALKKAGDGAHVGLKLGLNSLYGKLVQQIGWSVDRKGNLRKPPFHCLEWGGYITSHCRAQVFRAAMNAPHDVIAFETDAVFTRVPLPVKLSDRLGEWEATEYESLTYVKSGMYYGTLTDGTTQVVKSRGIDKDSLTRADAIAMLNDSSVEFIGAKQTRFIGLGLALNTSMDKWRRWITADREIRSPRHTLTSKRIPALTSEHFSPKYGTDTWEETWPGFAGTKNERPSYPYKVEWIEEPLTEHYDDEVDKARDHYGEDSLEWGV